MKYSIDYYDGKKDTCKDFMKLICDIADMGAIDNDVKNMLTTYINNNIKMYENQIGIILDTMLDEKRSIYEW